MLAPDVVLATPAFDKHVHEVNPKGKDIKIPHDMAVGVKQAC
ncbi:MAG: hypothetical protein ABSB32_13340 [Thermodesulfobacteriota bacterium]